MIEALIAAGALGTAIAIIWAVVLRGRLLVSEEKRKFLAAESSSLRLELDTVLDDKAEEVLRLENLRTHLKARIEELTGDMNACTCAVVVARRRERLSKATPNPTRPPDGVHE